MRASLPLFGTELNEATIVTRETSEIDEKIQEYMRGGWCVAETASVLCISLEASVTWFGDSPPIIPGRASSDGHFSHADSKAIYHRQQAPAHQSIE
jgi:hypothetical protein